MNLNTSFEDEDTSQLIEAVFTLPSNLFISDHVIEMVNVQEMLPIYLKKIPSKNSEDVDLCPVCLEPFEDDQVLRLKSCHHLLCQECSYKMKEHRCPICRAKF